MDCIKVLQHIMLTHYPFVVIDIVNGCRFIEE